MPGSNMVPNEARDYYEVLGAAPSATPEELRAAFRSLRSNKTGLAASPVHDFESLC